MQDKQGREYAKLSTLSPGDKVEVDSDFSCLRNGEVYVVCKDEEGLYIECTRGHHYLDSQLAFHSSDSLIGIYPVK